MATDVYLVTYMVPVTIPVEVGAGGQGARRAADGLMTQLEGRTVRMHVQGAPFDSPVITEVEIGTAEGAPTIAIDER